jgi:hypothetical protein
MIPGRQKRPDYCHHLSMYYDTATHDEAALQGAGPVIQSSLKSPNIVTSTSLLHKEASSSREHSIKTWSTGSYDLDESVYQLEDEHPGALRDLDNANEHHFIGGDVAMSHHPTEGFLDRNVLAILKTVKFPRFIATSRTNVPLKTAARGFPHS